jgi:hypothetical protein
MAVDRSRSAGGSLGAHQAHQRVLGGSIGAK